MMENKEIRLAADERWETVKVVRCKVCKLARRTEVYERYRRCMMSGCFVPEDHFCGYGT